MAGYASKEDRLAADLREALGLAARQLRVPISVRLWDNSLARFGDTDDEILTIAVASPGIVASLLKRPTPENLLRHYATGGIAILCNDLVEAGQEIRRSARKADLKRLPRWQIAMLLWRFLLVPATKPAMQHRYGGQEMREDDDRGRDNEDYIRFHYDAGNDFYSLFLDSEMLYSCAYFTDWNNGLEQAQRDKLDHICRKLRLKPGERFLDVGCGWGALICHAAQHYGVTAHGITLSHEQHAHVSEKIRALSLQDRVSVEIRDYRDLTGRFDKIASIGMFEHVGIENAPGYFRRLSGLLEERGLLLNHAIARRAKAKRKSRRRITAEKSLLLKYIFPGSELAPVGETVSAMEAHGFEVHDVEGLREHYGQTCAHWYRRLNSQRERAIELVGEERTNLWLAYLAGVSLGFQAGSMLIFQVLGSKRPKGKGPAGLPPTRADLYKSG